MLSDLEDSLIKSSSKVDYSAGDVPYLVTLFSNSFMTFQVGYLGRFAVGFGRPEYLLIR